MPFKEYIANLFRPLEIEREEPELTALVSTGHNRGLLAVSGFSTPYLVEKRWGSERIYQNNDLYCAKLLEIEPKMYTSMHYHLDKHETMINIGPGPLYIDYIDDKKVKTTELKVFESFVIAPGLSHRLRAGSKKVNLIEASTTSYDNDSIRLPEGIKNER